MNHNANFERSIRASWAHSSATGFSAPILGPMTHPPVPPDYVLRRIRTRLVAQIERRGIPIARLARRANISKGTVHKFLGDAPRDVHLGTICALCEVLELDIADLFAPLPEEGGS